MEEIWSTVWISLRWRFFTRRLVRLWSLSSQPAVTAIEKRGNEVKLGTLKCYIEALGGKLSLQIEFPDGVKQLKI